MKVTIESWKRYEYDGINLLRVDEKYDSSDDLEEAWRYEYDASAETGGQRPLPTHHPSSPPPARCSGCGDLTSTTKRESSRSKTTPSTANGSRTSTASVVFPFHYWSGRA